MNVTCYLIQDFFFCFGFIAHVSTTMKNCLCPAYDRKLIYKHAHCLGILSFSQKMQFTLRPLILRRRAVTFFSFYFNLRLLFLCIIVRSIAGIFFLFIILIRNSSSCTEMFLLVLPFQSFGQHQEDNVLFLKGQRWRCRVT